MVFLAHGLLFASWTAHIPTVKADLGLTDGRLGVALLGAPLGAVSAMILCAFLLPRLGSRRIVQAALLGYCTVGPVVGVAGNLGELFAALFGWGAFQGTLDVAMNTQAVAVERAGKRKLMSGLHGGWSIGSLTGAGIGAVAVSRGVALSEQLLVLGGVALVSAGLLTTWMLPDAVTDPYAGSRVGPTRIVERATSRWTGALLMLGAIAFASMLCEGATADWSSVYLSGPLRATGVVPGLGYTAFCLAMVTVRLSGNRLLSRFRSQRLLPVLAAIATLGFGAALLAGRPPVAIAGFLCLGVGLASVVPAVFSAAGRTAGLHPGTAVAMVSAFGWAGFVCGPPAIGRLASWTSLPIALGLLPLLTSFVVVGTLTAHGFRINDHNDNESERDSRQLAGVHHGID